MALTASIFLKKSTVSGTIPVASEMTSSQLAINLGDGGLFYSNVTSSTVELIRAGSASFAETASFALVAGSGGDGGGTGSNSGSFTGSFTGALLGSASFAQNAISSVLATSAVTAITASNANTASFADPSLFTAHVPIKTIANTNPYAVLFQDKTLLIDAVSGTLPIVVQLPDTTVFMKGPAAKIIHVIKIAGTNNVEVQASGSETVIGDATATLTDQYQGLTLQPSGGIWWVI